MMVDLAKGAPAAAAFALLLAAGACGSSDDENPTASGTSVGGGATASTTGPGGSGTGGEGAAGGGTGGAGGGDGDGLYRPDDGPTSEGGTVVAVCNESEILSAIADASPGDVITVCPGTFAFNQLISVNRDGADDARIFLRAEQPGTVTFSLSHIENFKISAKFWVFENISYVGACTNGNGCEHAFHIVADADDVIVRNNEVIDFASHVKLNAEIVGSGPAKAFPDRTWFINNVWRNTKFIPNNAPHNILNLDGGKDHVVRGNLFADYATSPSSGRSASAVYPKASARGILIEQNLIVCEKDRTNGETTRGIQLGDGAPASICDGDVDQDGNGDCEENGQSQFAVVRNNIVIGCNNGGSSAGIIVGSDNGSKIYHNTVVGAEPRAGAFHVGHPVHDTFFRFNVLEGGFDTNFAMNTPVESDNFMPDGAGVAALFTAAATGDFSVVDGSAVVGLASPSDDVPHDFCGYPRSADPDLGAIEYSTSYDGGPDCATSVQQRYQAIP
ncbi:MAG: hypothetical protein AAF715_26895 [Myxococcota bacterium]